MMHNISMHTKPRVQRTWHSLRNVTALAVASSVLLGCGGNFGNEPAAQQTAAPAPAATAAPAVAATATPGAGALAEQTDPNLTATVVVDPDVTQGATTNAANDAPVDDLSLGAIVDDPDAYVDQTVTVRGDVSELVGERAFRLNDRALVGGEALLVVPTTSDVPVTDNDRVAVTGVVRQFDLGAVEQEAGVDLRDELFADVTGQVVIVAQTVATVGREAAALVGVGEVVRDPQAFSGQMVMMTGRIAESLTADDTVVANGPFIINDPALLDAGSMLVLGANPAVGADIDATWFDLDAEAADVLISGTVRTFVVQELEADYDLDLQDSVYTNYENQPVLIAERVLPVITLGELTSDPNRYQGRTLAVNGNLSERIDQRFFRLNEDELLQGDDLLVFNAIGLEAAAVTATVVVGADEAANADATSDAVPNTGAPLDGTANNGGLDLADNAGLWVIGTVRAFAIADIEQEYNLDLDDEPFADDVDKPVIIASDILPME